MRVTTLTSAPSAPAIRQPKKVVRFDRHLARGEQDPDRHRDRAEGEHAAEHPAEVDDLRLAGRRLLVVLSGDAVELVSCSWISSGVSGIDLSLRVRSGRDHQVAHPDEEPVHEQPLAQAPQRVPHGDVLHLRPVEDLGDLGMHAHEPLRLGVHLDPIRPGAEQPAVEPLRVDRRHRDRHRAPLADVGVGDLPVVGDERRAQAPGSDLPRLALLADGPCFDELGERDASRLGAACGGHPSVPSYGCAISAIRASPPEPAARLPFAFSASVGDRAGTAQAALDPLQH